jgi:hypothetical protein
MTFNPNWIWRPVVLELLNFPNCGLVSLHAVPGARPMHVIPGLFDDGGKNVGVFVSAIVLSVRFQPIV